MITRYHPSGIIPEVSSICLWMKKTCALSVRARRRERERERRNKRCASEVVDRRQAIARGRRTRTRESKKKQQVEEQQG
jgi:hypothetical protein